MGGSTMNCVKESLVGRLYRVFLSASPTPKAEHSGRPIMEIEVVC